MNKRLVWNFEISTDNTLKVPSLVDEADPSQKRWESRFFWPDDQVITLHGLSDHFLALSHYQIKHRQDTYYLIPYAHYNIKMRHNQLFYKPLLMKKMSAVAYGKKIVLEEQASGVQLPGCDEKDAQALIARINHQGIAIHVEKEALIYTFETTPITKLELSWLHVGNKAYLSTSIESRSLPLVKSMSQQIVGHSAGCDYVTFLRETIP